MYGKTAESFHFIPRTGSHSTKGSRNGRVDVLPPSAQSSIYGELKVRREALVAKVGEAGAVLTKLNSERDSLLGLQQDWSVRVQQARLYGRPNPKRPEKLLIFDRRYAEAKKVYGVAVHNLKSLNAMADVREIRKAEWHHLFVLVAEQILDTPTFDRLKYETKRRFEIAKDSE